MAFFRIEGANRLAGTIAPMGGDRIGRRRLDTHLLALQTLGATVRVTATRYELTADRLVGCDMFLDEMSVTGTEQAILAAWNTSRANAHLYVEITLGDSVRQRGATDMLNACIRKQRVDDVT